MQVSCVTVVDDQTIVTSNSVPTCSELGNRKPLAGDGLLLTVTQPHHRSERLALTVQTRAEPIATMLSGPRHPGHTTESHHKKHRAHPQH